jgi:hypothetical protein
MKSWLRGSSSAVRVSYQFWIGYNWLPRRGGGGTAGPGSSHGIKSWLRRAAFALYQSLARQGLPCYFLPTISFKGLNRDCRAIILNEALFVDKSASVVSGLRKEPAL